MDPDRTTSSETRRRWRGPAIAAAALAAALVIALPLWFVFRGDDSPPVVTQPTVVTTTMPGSTTTIPAGTSTTTVGGLATTTTVPTTTTTVPSIESLWASPLSSLVAVSAEEAWAFGGGFDWSGIAHFLDGAWAWAWFIDMSIDTDMPAFTADYAVLRAVSGLAVAPDGTVWVSGGGGVFSGVFSVDGVEWTRRFDYPAGGVAVAPDGTVWIGADWWLARWDGGSWVPVGWDPQQPPDITGYPIRDAACRPRSGVATSDGEVWMVACAGGWGYDAWLLHYDGATLWQVETDGTTVRDGDPPFSGWWLFDSLHVEAAPNGDVWTLMRRHGTGEWLLGRFDGEAWTTYTVPFASTGHEPSSDFAYWQRAMAVGPDGVVWFALWDGLIAFNGTDWTNHLQGQTVTNIDVAPDGTVWYTDEQGAHILGS